MITLDKVSQIPLFKQQLSPSKGLILQNGENDIHAMAFDGTHVWVALCKSPSVLLKVDPLTFQYQKIVAKPGGAHYLTFDGEYMWFCHGGGISRVNIGTGEYKEYPLEISEWTIVGKFPYAMAFDGEHLWIGLYSQPGRLIRFDRAKAQQKEYIIPEAPAWSIRSLAFDGTYMWAAIYTAPGKVAKVHVETGEKEVICLGYENILPNAVVYDGKSIWVGLDSMPARIVKINPQTGEYIPYTFHQDSSSVRALLFDGRNLWVGLYTAPAQVVKFDVNTNEFEVIQLPDGYGNVRALTFDGVNIWVGLQQNRKESSRLYRI